MIAVLCAVGALGYWLGGRRPIRVVDGHRGWGARQWRALAFAAGLAMLAVIAADPVDTLVRHAFWTRTSQLIVLVMVAAPLLVLGAPTPRFRRLVGLPSREVGRPGRLGSVLAFSLFNGAMVLAYIPPVYAATASAGWPRTVAQMAMVALAFLFWSQVIAQPPRRCGLTHIGRVFYLFLSSAQVRILGLVLGFASTPFYAAPLVDQQIAAGILLVPGVLTDLIVLTVCLYMWLGQDDRRPSELLPPRLRRAGAVRAHS
jgi:putative membrane protein